MHSYTLTYDKIELIDYPASRGAAYPVGNTDSQPPHSIYQMNHGLMTASLGMQTDEFHSFFDGASNVIRLAGRWLASHSPDLNHAYGHKKVEALAAAATRGTILFLIQFFQFLTLRHIRPAFDLPTTTQ
ncbi:MAG: hypothetical protein GKS05_05520 [Nitrospirales bacterium]|nr:hypothetical protein [Nitrospirales bacterium]